MWPSCVASFTHLTFDCIVRIKINGEPRDLPQGPITLKELVDILKLTPQRIAVEVNRTIVRRNDWEKTTLREGDQIEIVHFVGGGEGRQEEYPRNFCSISERV